MVLAERRGITITELAVVIVIISLLVIAVIGGRHIQQAAQLHGFSADLRRFHIAVDSFVDKYQYYPGDMPNAQDYWGVYDMSTSQGTVNGNGDGYVDLPDPAADPFAIESYRAWQHLVLAGYITGGYTGVAVSGGANNQSDIGVNVPAAQRNQVGYVLRYGSLYEGSSHNALIIGAFLSGGISYNAALSPVEMQSLDQKLDDGMARTGFLQGIEGQNVAAGLCVEDTYQLSQDEILCILSLRVDL